MVWIWDSSVSICTADERSKVGPPRWSDQEFWASLPIHDQWVHSVYTSNLKYRLGNTSGRMVQEDPRCVVYDWWDARPLSRRPKVSKEAGNRGINMKKARKRIFCQRVSFINRAVNSCAVCKARFKVVHILTIGTFKLEVLTNSLSHYHQMVIDFPDLRFRTGWSLTRMWQWKAYGHKSRIIKTSIIGTSITSEVSGKKFWHFLWARCQCSGLGTSVRAKALS